MFRDKKVLAVIPSRAGSKRLPHKNILGLAGKPLISWSINAGLESDYIDRVVVSTEDEEIAEVARMSGASVPFLRPKELATDKARTIDVLTHAIHALRKVGDFYEYLVLLQPTSPLRNSKHLDEAFEIMNDSNADGVISVCPVEHPVEWTNTLPPDGRMDNFLKPEHINRQSEDFDERYQLNGAIYLVAVDKLLKEETLFLSAGVVAYVMERRVSVDIDTLDDFLLAEYLLTHDEGAGQSQVNRGSSP